MRPAHFIRAPFLHDGNSHPRRRRAVLASVLLAALCPTALLAFEQSVLSLTVTHQSYDPQVPWQKSEPGTRRGYATVVGKGLLLTTETTVRNHTLVQLRKTRSGERITASVELADFDSNLALLRIPDDKAIGMVPIKLAPEVPHDAQLTIVQFNESRGIQEGNAQIVSISVAPLPSAPSGILSFKALTDLNVNGTGAPAMRNGLLAGIVMSYDRGSRIASVLPHSVLKHFMDDFNDQPYRGFVTAGFMWTPLVDPSKRAFLNATNSNLGIEIVATSPQTGASRTLMPEDVILRWGGHSIDNLGFYEDPAYGRLAVAHLIKGSHYPGDIVKVDIIRDRKPMTVQVELTRRNEWNALIPENTTSKRDEYIVDGGFLIRELTGSYLRAGGSRGFGHAGSRVNHLYQSGAKPETPGERVVVLARVLPDPINVGYGRMVGQIITHVNGRPIKNMGDVFEGLEADRGLKRLTLRSIGIDLVLDQEKLPEANERLQDTYQIPQLRYRNPE